MVNNIIKRVLRMLGKDAYVEDGLISVHNHDFLNSPIFQKAYARGIRSAEADYGFRWRVHVALWAASTANHLDGDFVECGVSKGFISSAIMEAIDWNSQDKTYYLLDTFSGLDPSQVLEKEKSLGYLEQSEKAIALGHYANKLESVTKNFSQWQRVVIIKGSIPQTLSKVEANSISFLHIDLNCSTPEVAAINHFWDLIVPGGIVLLDDYAYTGYQLSKSGMDEFARKVGIQILSLPTGQGLIVKSPR